MVARDRVWMACDHPRAFVVSSRDCAPTADIPCSCHRCHDSHFRLPDGKPAIRFKGIGDTAAAGRCGRCCQKSPPGAGVVIAAARSCCVRMVGTSRNPAELAAPTVAATLVSAGHILRRALSQSGLRSTECARRSPMRVSASSSVVRTTACRRGRIPSPRKSIP